MFKKTLSFIRETQNFGLFFPVTMSLRMFSFIAPMMLPYILVTHVAYALLNGFNLIRARNKNIDKWLDLIASLMSLGLISTSLIFVIYAVALTVAPWLFISSMLVSAAHQLFIAGLNLYRAFEAVSGSEQRKNYMQTALQHLFSTGLIAIAALATTVLLLHIPISFVTAALFVGALVLATEVSAHLMWRVLPTHWKDSIKSMLALNEHVVEDNFTPKAIEVKKESISSARPGHYSRIFTCVDHVAAVKAMDFEAAKLYVQAHIEQKIEALANKQHPLSKQLQDKKNLLIFLRQSLESGQEIPLKKHEQYPLAFQSFLMVKGEVETLYDATILLLQPYKCNVENGIVPSLN